MSKVTIAAMPLEPDNLGVCRVQIREPGIVRALGFGIKQGSLIDIPGQPKEVEEQVIAFVECWPDGAFHERVFVVKATNRVATPTAGLRAQWAATGMSMASGRIAHLLELVPLDKPDPTAITGSDSTAEEPSP